MRREALDVFREGCGIYYTLVQINEYLPIKSVRITCSDLRKSSASVYGSMINIQLAIPW